MQQIGAAQQPTNKRPVVLAVTVVALTLGWLIAALSQSRAAYPRPPLHAAILVVVPVLSISILVIRARADTDLRTAWSFLAAGSAINLFVTLPEIQGDQVWLGQPSISDWVSLACAPLLIIGVVLLLRPAQVLARGARTDGAILILASAAVLAAAWQQPEVTWRATPGTLFDLTAAVTYVVLLISMGAATISARFRISPACLFLWSGILVWGFGELALLNQTLAGAEASFSSVAGTWLIGFALFAMAGIAPSGPGTESQVRQWSARAPVYSALLAGAILLVSLIQPVSTLATLLAVATLMLAVVRQFANLAEVDRAHRMHAEARTDDLTGLLNRRGLYEVLTYSLASQSQVALLMVDLDEFKEINDSLGHQAGDEMLVIVANRLRLTCPESADVARLGGDEFAIAVVGQTDPEEVAKTILGSLKAPTVVHDTEVRISASVGIACYPRHADNIDELLRAADFAMYTAKREHCITCTYRAELDPHSRDQLQLLAELRNAIPAGQLVVVYQPQCRLSDGVITSVESLLRWEHPTRGQLLPSAFIRQAESSGVICEMTNFVLDRALSDLRTWLDAGADIDLSVNISGVDVLFRGEVYKLAFITGQ